MEARKGGVAPSRTAARAWNKPCGLALAVAMALGLSACGGGGGGGGNVRSTSPSTPTSPTNPSTPSGFTGGEIDVAAGQSTTLADTVTGNTGIIKGGAGTLTLTGASSYTGSTLVASGALYVNGNQSAATGATSVSTGATLGGNGTLGGDVNVADGATLAPGAVGAVGTLTINGSLNLASGALLNFDFAQASGGTQASDLINVKGNLTLAGTLNASVASGGDLGPGVHRLINYDGSLVNNGLNLGTLPSDHWVVQTGVAHQVNLVDTSGMNFSYWDGAGPKENNAINGGSGTWEAGGPDASWTDASGALNAHYTNGSFAVFQDDPGTVTVNNSNGAVTVAGMQFTTYGYLIQGDPLQLVGSAADPTHSIIRVGDGTADGSRYLATFNNVLSGDTTLVKTDLGKLALAGENTYTGGTTISGGTLMVGTGGTTGSILGDVVDNATLVFNRSDATTFTGIISGTGTVVKAGTGTMTLVGANTYTGGTQVQGGTLALYTGSTAGTGDITVGNAGDQEFFDPNSTLQISHGYGLANHVVLQGNGVLDNAGILTGTSDAPVTSIFTVGGKAIVSNHDGGYIRGDHTAIDMASYGATVNNASGGVIEGGDIAINFDAKGQVNNDGAGSIIRSATGIAIHGGTVSVSNTGGGTISGPSDAIVGSTGGGVRNDGAGSTITSSGGMAILMLGGGGGVSNTGGAIISSPNTAIYLQQGGSVTNGAGSTIQTTGTATGNCAGSGNCAIFAETAPPVSGDGAVVLSNAGTIIGNVQLLPNAGNRVTLVPGGSIHGDLNIGNTYAASLTLQGAAGTAQRYSQAVTGASTFGGFMTGPTEGTWIIDKDGLTPGAVNLVGGTLQIGDGGTTGWLGNANISLNRDATLIFDRSDDVTFAGSIAGMGHEPYNDRLVKTGTGTLTLALSGYINPSNITIEQGTLQIDNTGDLAPINGNSSFGGATVNNGALVFDSNTNLHVGEISGSGSVTQNGSGLVLLEGQNTYTGDTTINKGSVRAMYTLPGNVFVNTDGTLDGDSLLSPNPGLPGVAGNLSNAGKVAVRAGDAVIGGTYTQSSSGTLAVSLGSKLAVTGAATLNGGTLEVTGADSGYVSNNHTEVLTAGQGLTGRFGPLVKDSGVVFTATTISYDGNSAWLDTTGLDVTTAAAGQGVTYTRASSNSAVRVQSAFTQLNSQLAAGNASSASAGFMQAAGEFQQAPTLQAAQASLQSLSGQLHAASAAMTFESIDASSRALSEHFDSMLGARTGYGTWMQNLSVGGDMARSGYNGVGFQLNGWLVGNDRQIGSSGVAGFAFGQSQGQQQLDQSADRNRSRNTEGMLYAGWLSGNWYTQGRVGFGHFQQDVSRTLLLGMSAQGVATNYSGDYNVAYGESGLHLNWGGTRFMPFASVEYARIDRDGFAEQGAGGFGLRADAQVIDRWQAGVGMRAARHWSLEGGRGIDFTAGAQFRRTLASHGDVFDASFVGLSQWQPLTGVGLSRYSAVFNLGLDAALTARSSLKVGYDYQKGQRDQAQTLSARWVMAL
jgi:autotransporter-associated beta strand protein